MIELSNQQSTAVKELQRLLAEGKPLVTLGGYAGSGKSTIIPYVVEGLDLSKTAFCCFTGKASQVLRSKMQAAGVADDAAHLGTIHSLIYQLQKEDDDGRMHWSKKSKLPSITHIVVDEASMVGADILRDLQSYGAQILAVGDPAQLPPVQDKSVMMSPDFTLTEVHRQAEESPIIRVATYVRQHWCLPDTDDVVFIDYEQADEVVEGLSAMDWAVLTRSNKVRTSLNEELCGKKPVAGSTVICLRNYWDKGLYNGLRGTVSKVERWGKYHGTLTVDFPDALLGQGPVTLADVNVPQFNMASGVTLRYMNDLQRRGSKKGRGTSGMWAEKPEVGTLLDFGTAMTVHKAQGSGFHTVLVVPEEWEWNKSEKEDWKKWLYTAVTRASDKLYFLPKE